MSSSANVPYTHTHTTVYSKWETCRHAQCTMQVSCPWRTTIRSLAKSPQRVPQLF